MRRLIVHLGLWKTATTSLQTHVFPRLKGYVGKSNAGNIYSSNAFCRFHEVFSSGALIDGRRVFEKDGHEVWIPALESCVGELLANSEEILLWSDEDLSVWRSPIGSAAGAPVQDARGALPRRGSHPVVKFLEHLRALLPVEVELKTVLTLRNQSDWLGSLAAQVGVQDTGFVDRLIRDDDAFLDFYTITKDLERLRGPQNHLTLLFENGLDNNVQEILVFAGYSAADFENVEVAHAHENKLKGKAGWNVQRSRPNERLERMLRTLRDRSPLVERHVSSNEALRRLLRPLFGFEARQRALGGIPALGKSVTISITEGQRDAIRHHCRESNARLSAHLDEDLKTFGY